MNWANSWSPASQGSTCLGPSGSCQPKMLEVIDGYGFQLPGFISFYIHQKWWRNPICWDIYPPVDEDWWWISSSQAKIVWLVVWHMIFSPYIGNNNPDWRTHIFQRGGSTTKQDLMVIFMGCAWFLWDCIESDRDIMGFICDFIIIWISAGISGKLCNHKQCGIHPMPCTTWGKIDICWFSPTRWLARCCEMVLHQICFLLG